PLLPEPEPPSERPPPRRLDEPLMTFGASGVRSAGSPANGSSATAGSSSQNSSSEPRGASSGSATGASSGGPGENSTEPPAVRDGEASPGPPPAPPSMSTPFSLRPRFSSRSRRRCSRSRAAGSSGLAKGSSAIQSSVIGPLLDRGLTGEVGLKEMSGGDRVA